VDDDLPDLDPDRRDRLPRRRARALSVLRTCGLAKRYGSTHALAGIDLDVPEGAIYGLVGPNGSGKTTALELIAGLRRPSGGTIEHGVRQASIAYCPDAAEFEPWLTALEVLDASAGLVGRPQPREAIASMLDRVGLADAAGRRVSGFSRGMRSRLNLAAGLITGPELLIADEPAAALDPAGRREIVDLLAALAGSTALIVSSHDLADVERICDSIGVLARGRLVYQGPVAELLARASPQLRVVVRPPADRLRGALEASPWARSVVEDEPGELVVDVTDPAGAELELPRLLAECEARLVEVGRAGVSLQDVFFELTETGPGRPDDAEQAR
jgi:ABC-2 type transport system ATP-binding protein